MNNDYLQRTKSSHITYGASNFPNFNLKSREMFLGQVSKFTAKEF
jgi:hypothetical protein